MTKFFAWSWKPKNIIGSVKSWQTFPRMELNKTISKLENQTIREMRKAAPVSSGRLRASIRSISKKTATGGYDLRSSVAIGSDLPYAIYQDKGTRPSPGRYVPFLNRRLVRPALGMHPGVKPTGFMTKTAEKMDQVIAYEAEKLMDKWRRRIRA